MKKYIITSLLVLMPAIVMAADRCTNPDEYTIDRRCYVTDEQKAQKPYSAIVGILGKDGSIKCTGTIVKENDAYRVYTATTCVRYEIWSGDTFHYEYDNLKVKLQDNRIFEVGKHNADRDRKDITVYTFPNGKAVENIAITSTDNVNSKSAVYEDVRLVGYGALKIMSDKEISNLKKEYEEYLLEDGYSTTPDEKGGIDVNTRRLVERWPGLSKDNDNLKESVCDYYVKYGADGCQGWLGNEGGPLIDKDDKIMAVELGDRYVIGGEDHARVAGGAPDTEWAGTVSLLKDAESKK